MIRSRLRIALGTFIVVAVVGVGMVVVHSCSKLLTVEDQGPAISAKSPPEVGVQPTRQTAPALAHPTFGAEAGGRSQMSESKVAPPHQARDRERGRLSPLQLMEDYLGLSDEQARKLEPVLKEQRDKLNALRRDTSLSRKDKAVRLKELQQGTDAKIRAQLTPEQAAKWQRRTLNASAMSMSQRQGPGSASSRARSMSVPVGGEAQTLPNWRRQPTPPPPVIQPAQPAAIK